MTDEVKDEDEVEDEFVVTPSFCEFDHSELGDRVAWALNLENGEPWNNRCCIISVAWDAGGRP